MLADLLAAVEMTGARFDLRALSLTSFAPESAAGRDTLECGLAVLDRRRRRRRLPGGDATLRTRRGGRRLFRPPPAPSLARQW